MIEHTVTRTKPVRRYVIEGDDADTLYALASKELPYFLQYRIADLARRLRVTPSETEA